MPFDPKIPREFANKMGREAMQVIELGLYATPTSRQVDIAADIASAVARTTHLPPDHRHTFPRTGKCATLVEVTEETSLSAAFRHHEAGLRTMVLNFASPTVPGGGFLPANARRRNTTAALPPSSPARSPARCMPSTRIRPTRCVRTR